VRSLALLREDETVDDVVKFWPIDGHQHPHVAGMKHGTLGHDHPSLVDPRRLDNLGTGRACVLQEDLAVLEHGRFVHHSDQSSRLNTTTGKMMRLI
jgi:hypothetical protein